MSKIFQAFPFAISCNVIAFEILLSIFLWRQTENVANRSKKFLLWDFKDTEIREDAKIKKTGVVLGNIIGKTGLVL